MKVDAGFLIRAAAVDFGEREALSWGSGSQTFSQLNDSANQVGSALLDLGVKQGDRVGVLAYNGPEVIHSWLGFEKHNIVRVVLHSHFDVEAHVASLNHVEATALVFDSRFADQVEQVRSKLETVRHLVYIGQDGPDWASSFSELRDSGDSREPYLDVDEDTPCFLQLTSGTTGHPKAWVKTYRSWRAVVAHNLMHLDTHGRDTPPIGPDDVNVHFHAVQWASGFQTLYPYLLRGARTVMVDDEVFDAAAVLDTFQKEGATGTFMPAPLLTPILDEVEQRGGVKHNLERIVIFFGTPELLERTTKLLGPIWSHGFGSTEQGAVTTRLLPDHVAEKPGRLSSVGRPGSPFLEVAILNEDGERLPPGQLGEIAVRSAMSIGEYWGSPTISEESFFSGDWFRPSDIGYLDEDGFLYYSDRAGDAIATAAGTVYPHLIEAAVLRHNSVANCGVVGLGDDGAQQVVAAVTLKSEKAASDALADEIMDTAGDGLKPEERPERIVFVDELPTVLGGAKVQRSVLRDQLANSTK